MKQFTTLLFLFAFISCNGGGGGGSGTPEIDTPSSPEEQVQPLIPDNRFVYLAKDDNADTALFKLNSDDTVTRLHGFAGSDATELTTVAHAQMDFYLLDPGSGTTDPFIYDHLNNTAINIKTDLFGEDPSTVPNIIVNAVTRFKDGSDSVFTNRLWFQCSGMGFDICWVQRKDGESTISHGSMDLPSSAFSPLYLGSVTDSDQNTYPCYRNNLGSGDYTVECMDYQILPPNDIFWSGVFGIATTSVPGQMVIHGNTGTEGIDIFTFQDGNYVTTEEVISGTSAANIAWIEGVGDSVYFETTRSGDTQDYIYKFTPSTNTMVQLLAPDQPGAQNFSFRGHDDTHLYITQNTADGSELFAVDMLTGTATQIKDNPSGNSTIYDTEQVSDLLYAVTYHGTSREFSVFSGGTYTDLSLGLMDPSMTIYILGASDEKVYFSGTASGYSLFLHVYDIATDTVTPITDSQIAVNAQNSSIAFGGFVNDHER